MISGSLARRSCGTGGSLGTRLASEASSVLGDSTLSFCWRNSWDGRLIIFRVLREPWEPCLVSLATLVTERLRCLSALVPAPDLSTIAPPRIRDKTFWAATNGILPSMSVSRKRKTRRSFFSRTLSSSPVSIRVNILPRRGMRDATRTMRDKRFSRVAFDPRAATLRSRVSREERPATKASLDWKMAWKSHVSGKREISAIVSSQK
mmetsp:Transcript_53341/g.96068  ORF Transcript_53341/g.96068 Transcript_53341/m.96068 type:complete len:206 (-) Transcript_53341:364-981(-)